MLDFDIKYTKEDIKEGDIFINSMCDMIGSNAGEYFLNIVLGTNKKHINDDCWNKRIEIRGAWADGSLVYHVCAMRYVDNVLIETNIWDDWVAPHFDGMVKL